MPTVDQIRAGSTTRPATMTSTADGREHVISEQVEPSPTEQHLVTAHCDSRQFRSVAALPGTPSDSAQVCPACRSKHHHTTN